MKKTVKRFVAISFCGVMFLLTSISVFGQPTVVEPGDKSIDPSLLKTGSFDWGQRQPRKGDGVNYDHNRAIKIQRSTKEITVEDRITDYKGIGVETWTMTLNPKTLEPIRSTYKGEGGSFDLQYGARLKGIVDDYTTGKKTTINEPIEGKYFQIDSLNYVISTLPLSPTYRVTIPVIRLARGFKPQTHRYQITDVTEISDHSCVSGPRDLWRVKAVDKQSRVYRVILIEKKTRRIVRTQVMDMDYDNIWEGDITYDKETDVNPLKTPFNAAEVRAMITGGTSSIKGQAWTTAEAPGRNKKQYAQKGSVVALYPLTQYFKDWFTYNAALQRLGTPRYPDVSYDCKIPLPREVRKESLLTEVIDDKGNFSFGGLKPGEYLVLVAFTATKYSHTTSTPNGYSVTVYPDGSATGGTTYDVKDWVTSENILNYAYVTVKKEGEAVKVKLDK